ncbi:unnamed protein product [Paramecium sonneborni]|uniref:Uncharacterized protein n=1 Tax=Paramecium sonneborni TaxID=65129 RepID=A0A8S1MQ66_9CILI|nr:unnamed protein product [Paramecium sonneborni]
MYGMNQRIRKYDNNNIFKLRYKTDIHIRRDALIYQFEKKKQELS